MEFMTCGEPAALSLPSLTSAGKRERERARERKSEGARGRDRKRER
jgi:hypothetical protein